MPKTITNQQPPAKAMILAAGKGVRFRPVTHYLPKPMIPILGKPMMAYQIEYLAHHGIDSVMINVAWHHSLIENYFGNGQRFGVEIGYSFEGYYQDDAVIANPLGSAGGMRRIQDFGGFFDRTTVVLCGDALIDLDLHAAITEHRAKKALASVITTPVALENVHQYGIVCSNNDGRVTSFQEKPGSQQARSNQASTGIYIFEPEIFDWIPQGQKFDIGSDLFPLLVKKELPFYSQQHNFLWLDMGNVKDYWTLLQDILGKGILYTSMPGTEIQPGVWVGLNTAIDWDKVEIIGPVYIGSQTRIEAGTKIMGPTWIGHGCTIKKNARLARSILFEYTQVHADAVLNECVLSPTYLVSKEGHTTHHHEVKSPIWGDARQAW